MYLESFEIWLWRRVEKIIWSKKWNVMKRVGEERKIL